ncbi:WD-repeat protein [Reticulomyxa filosa]|uniref:WD-repeat protein n=1 Tax=Reticulomyxa filosa TaxID=46433 RepID=X6MQ27_RETFI|nr:WD-repeat protein [Reticulomyxa filosa]|eukprot:ETO15537.1 WD-repeat protein [Reticulomyxa filosa]
MDIQFVLDHLTIPFEYGILKQLNNLMYSKDVITMCGVVRLWDIRSCQQIQVFNGHTNKVCAVEYPPFVIKNNIGNSNVICSGSYDNTIRFWDIRSDKNELYMIKGDDKEDNGVVCLKFIVLKKKDKTKDDVFYSTLFKKVEKAAFNDQYYFFMCLLYNIEHLKQYEVKRFNFLNTIKSHNNI